MLFIYNHDNLYVKGVEEMLKDIAPKMIRLRTGLKIAVVGPERINYLGLPAVEWVNFRGKEALEALFSG